MVTRLIRKLDLLSGGLFPVLGSASAGVIVISLTAIVHWPVMAGVPRPLTWLSRP